MTHGEFVEGVRSGRIQVRADEFGARQFLESEPVPAAARLLHFAWVWMRLLCIPIGAVLAVAWSLWGGIAAGVVMAAAAYREPINRKAARRLKKLALRDEAIYRKAVERSILVPTAAPSAAGGGEAAAGKPPG